MSDYFKHAQDPSNKHFDPIHITACYLDPVRNLVLDEKKTEIAICNLKTLNKVKLEKILKFIIDRYKADCETIQAKLCSDATDNELEKNI